MTIQTDKNVTYWTESASRGHQLWMSDEIKQLNLLQRGLTGGQPPWLRQDLHKKWLHLFQWSLNTLFSSITKTAYLSRVKFLQNISKQLSPPWGRPILPQGIWRPHRDRRGADRCPAQSLPSGTCFGVSLPLLSATWGALLSLRPEVKKENQNERINYLNNSYSVKL